MKRAVLGVVPAMVAFMLLFVRAPAGTQFKDPLGSHWNNPGSAMLGTMIANKMLLDAARNDQPDAATPSSPAAKRPPRGPTSFRPVARRLVVTELARAIGADPKAQRDFARIFDYYLTAFDRQAAEEGDPAHDH